MKHSIASTQEEMPESPANQIIALLLNVLSAGSVSAPTTAVTRGRGRPATLSHDHLWLAMLQTMLQGSTSFASLWRLITWTGIGHLPILDLTRDAVRKRLLHAKLDSLHDLLARVSQAVLPWTTQVQDRDLAPFATRILALDQSTLDAVRRTCQDVREEPVESARLLVGKLAALFDIQRQQWVRVLFREDVFANEKLFVEELLAGIQKGTLILADLGYFSFAWFDWLTDQGYWWLSRMREKTSYQIVHVFVQQGTTLDALIWLGAYNADKAKHLVRLIQFEHAGICYRYVTNVRDPALLSMSDAARLYARRWDIELAFKMLKGELGLHLWWSSFPILVLQQLLCAFILAQSCMPCTCGWPQRRAWNSLRSPCRCWSSCWLTPRHEPWERACAVCWCAKATSRDLSALLDAINPSSRPCLNPTCLLLLTWCASGRSAMVGANASLVPIVRAFNRVFSLSF